MLVLLLFNWVGYRFLAGMMENRIDAQVESQLDSGDYIESQLVSFSIPLAHLPYYIASERFERFDGEIDMHGIRYKYVKRRLHNDSLEILCLPNFPVMRLIDEKNAFFERTNDLTQLASHSQNLPHKPVTKFSEPAFCESQCDPQLECFSAQLPGRAPDAPADLVSSIAEVNEQPPEPVIG